MTLANEKSTIELVVPPTENITFVDNTCSIFNPCVCLYLTSFSLLGLIIFLCVISYNANNNVMIILLYFTIVVLAFVIFFLMLYATCIFGRSWNECFNMSRQIILSARFCV